ncbi:MAG TPA: IMP cyclohydrolase [Oscillospiraceae bacterium]|nr:IMP cyclohydrolase [Oscillospiraceae bacterium]
MEMQDLCALLRANSYPGRGLVVGFTPGGGHALVLYFIMGRSANSRNRVFTPLDRGIQTEAADPKKLLDPSLIIYSPVRVFHNMIIVSNGDQTDTIFDYLQEGGNFHRAMCSRTFEPDAPNFTPRIAAILKYERNHLRVEVGILKSDGKGCCILRQFFEYDNPCPGRGRFISTYAGDGDPLPSFQGEPVPVALSDDIFDFGDAVWESLNEDNKISLFVRDLDLKTRTWKDKIYNKYERVPR